MIDYRNFNNHCEHKETRLVSRSDIEPVVYELIKAEMMRFRCSYGKDYRGTCAKQVARNGLYWVTSHSPDPDDLTIELYIDKKKRREHNV